MTAALVLVAGGAAVMALVNAWLVWNGHASVVAYRARDEAIVDRNAFERRAVLAEKELQDAGERIKTLRANLDECEKVRFTKGVQIITGLSGDELARRTAELFSEGMPADRADTDADGGAGPGTLPATAGAGGDPGDADV